MIGIKKVLRITGLFALSMTLLLANVWSANATDLANAPDEERFSLENIEIRLNGADAKQALHSKGIFTNVDRDEIMATVYQHNCNFLSSLFSGVYKKTPREKFATQDIYTEGNAHSLYTMVTRSGEGNSTVKSYDFNIKFEKISIKNDMAKVIVDRDAVATDHEKDNEPSVKISYGQLEAYVLKKIDGSWRIYNIIFQTDFLNDKFRELSIDENPSHWENTYSFENCPRKTYESDKNFSDYLIGDIEDAKIDYDMLGIDGSLGYEIKPDENIDENNPPNAVKANYSKAQAIAYATKHAADPNLQDYRYFGSLEGGDCTNFMSQCILAGGLPKTAGWYYYGQNNFSGTWVRVIELRDHLINNRLAKGYYQQLPPYPSGVDFKGTLIQFSNGGHGNIVPCLWGKTAKDIMLRNIQDQMAIQ